MNVIGINIKKERETRQLTLREMAKQVGVSASFLSQVETGKGSPTLATLKKIADVLHTTISALLGESTTGVESNPVLRAGERQAVSRLGDGVNMYFLTSPNPYKQMEPLLFRLEAGAVSGDTTYKHFGQEFILVLKGTMELVLNGTSYILRKGDSIYFNSNLPHSFKNVQQGETEAIWVVTPPSF